MNTFSQFYRSLVSQRIGARYDEILAYFAESPFGSCLPDLNTLSFLPPVDRCIILENIIFKTSFNSIAITDKLAMAYLKTGWNHLSHEFIDAAEKNNFIDQSLCNYLHGKMNRLKISNISKTYSDTVSSLTMTPFTSLKEILRRFCLTHAGRELNANVNESDWQDFMDERYAFICFLSDTKLFASNSRMD